MNLPVPTFIEQLPDRLSVPEYRPDLMTVIRTVGGVTCIAAALAESEILIPMVVGLYAIEVSNVIKNNPPTEFVELISKRNFNEAYKSGANYAASIGSRLLEEDPLTDMMVKNINSLSRKVFHAGSWLVRSLSSPNSN